MKPFALSIPEACKALGGISRATAYRMLERKEIEGYKLGSRSFITVESIEAAIARAPRLAA